MAESTEPQSSYELVDMEQMDDYIWRIRDFLDDDGSGAFGIHGIGGMGKTTLLQKINKDFDSIGAKRRFDRVIHLTVPRDFTFKIRSQIFESIYQTPLDLSPDHEAAIDVFLGSIICRCRSELNSLVLLDEVWDGFDLSQLEFFTPFGNEGKIILVSRSSSVFRSLGEIQDTIQVLEMEPWPDSESWVLFQNQVRRDLDQENSTILNHAKAIMRRCGGNPLALKITGRSMSNAQSAEDWKRAERDLAKYIDDVATRQHHVEEEVLSLLKFCFDRLRDVPTRQCLLYCCLLNKEKTLQVDELIKSLNREEFLGKFPYSTVQQILDDLISAGFIQEENSYGLLKMHDVVSEMCEWLIIAEYGIFSTSEGKEINYDMRILSSSDLQSIAKAIERLTKANVDLSDTKLGYLPHSVGWLGTLRRLNLSRTSIESLPSSMGFLVELQHLSLSGTKLKILPDSIGKLVSLTFLDLSKLEIQNLPNTISGLVELREFDLSNTELECLPSKIGALVKLRKLNVSCTKISSLPTEIGFLEDLKYLDLSNTELKFLPNSIGILPRLKSLNVSSTALQSIPNTIHGLQNLRMLDLSKTNLDYLPPSIGALVKLQWLDVSNTNLRSLPSTIGLLGELELLHFSWTQLDFLPDSIVDLKKLKNIDISITKFQILLNIKELKSESESKDCSIETM